MIKIDCDIRNSWKEDDSVLPATPPEVVLYASETTRGSISFRRKDGTEYYPVCLTGALISNSEIDYWVDHYIQELNRVRKKAKKALFDEKG